MDLLDLIFYFRTLKLIGVDVEQRIDSEYIPDILTRMLLCLLVAL